MTPSQHSEKWQAVWDSCQFKYDEREYLTKHDAALGSEKIDDIYAYGKILIKKITM